jgi:hypothetical protein
MFNCCPGCGCSLRWTKMKISDSNYSKICSVITTCMLDLQDTPYMDCTFVALLARDIIQKHHKLDVKVCSGQACVAYFDDSRSKQAFTFGNPRITGQQDQFHVWNLVEGELYDFSSPLYSLAFRNLDIPVRYMRIIPTEENRFEQSGTPIVFREDSNHRRKIIKNYTSDEQFKRCRSVCIDWYRTDAFHLEQLHICSRPFGRSEELRLKSVEFCGHW